MDLKHQLQFGPHRVEVITIHDKEGVRTLTAKCVDECCSANKVQITMAEGELIALAELYSGQVATVRMKESLNRVLAEMRANPLPAVLKQVSLEDEIKLPYNNRELMIRKYQYANMGVEE